MATERKVRSEERARVHAALADPARVRIVDLLADGDASPTDVQALLKMPSNLVAHHLRVLEQAGLLHRHRSEADRRRSYLRLLREPLDGLLPASLTHVPRVVFVCTANSARSQLAAALWARASEVPVSSAGTHPAGEIARGARGVAGKHGLTLVQPGPQALAAVLQPTDFVITVCDRAHEELDPGSVRAHWSVPDPVAVGTARAFDAAYAELDDRVTRLAPRLAPSATTS
ncbi:ArsR family transcriptional regulator [Nocardioides guangzhouensis]|uniref:ArsR family transcriptional regulator n=1 Tax=Nocardioides guangzhouensis TaxID=2497878 RepID=A0A4Q4ZIG4_9ACTN|nr:helix-turn-helix domain-containing protein [Nocardioides guangzhouensis]RYP88077.1 ArsR family transcriptional regulator [Nocardioides guangzhouensis]